MTGLLGLWWIWLAVALALGLAEVMLPGFIFLGFALGALTMALVVALFPSLSAPALLAIFAGLSLLAWIGLRLAFKRQSSGARIVRRDINDSK
jgi:membrane protein implicated in regulation of membrane protease activity